MEATIPYVERDSNGEIVCLYGAVAPMFAQARNYLSTDKLQERLCEYEAVHAEAERLGLSFDDAITDICSRWPEWVDGADISRPADFIEAMVDNYEPIPTPPIDEIREAYEESHDDSGTDEAGSDELALDDPGGDLGEEALVGDPDDPDFSDAVDELTPPNFGGVLLSGDPLKAAQMEATWAVGDKEEALVSQYASDENLARLNEMRGIALAIKEGVHPAFSTEEAEELQALETFASWLSSVRANADRLRNAIRAAQSIEAVQVIDLELGWPE